jgi:hypothetical protein
MPQFIVVPDQLTSILDAVNVLIGSLGEAAVTTIDPSPSTEVDNALLKLNEEDLALQSRGWAWNREYSWQTTLNEDGTVSLPANTLRCVNAFYTPGVPTGDFDIVARGGQLYDRAHHTNIFTTAPYVDLILRLPWTELPQSARGVITVEACKTFQAIQQASSIVLQVSLQDLAKRWAALEQEEDETDNHNSITGNLSTLGALYGKGGMRRNRGV